MRSSLVALLLMTAWFPQAALSIHFGGDSLTVASASREKESDHSSASRHEIQQILSQMGFQVSKRNTESFDFELIDLGGRKVHSNAFDGKLVLLNFWATWCVPCREEMPSMNDLQKKLKEQGLEIIAVDIQEDSQAVQHFVDEMKLDFTVLLDTSGRVASIYGVQFTPTSYLIGRDGLLLARTVGGRNWLDPELVAAFERILQLDAET